VQFISHTPFGGVISRRLTPADSATAADINRDGFADIVRASYQQSAVLLRYGPSWASEITIAATSRPDHVAAADMNADGWPDLILSSFDAGTVTVRRGPSFTQSSVTSVPGVRKVVPADLDTDGDVDLVAAKSYATGLVVLRNTAGVFSTQTIASGWTASDVAIDADGDVYAIDYFRDRLVRYPNLAGVIGPGTAVASVMAPVSVARSDGALYVAGFFDGTITRISTTDHQTSLFAQSQPGISSIDAIEGDVRWSTSVELWLGDLNGDGLTDELSCEWVRLTSSIPAAS